MLLSLDINHLIFEMDNTPKFYLAFAKAVGASSQTDGEVLLLKKIPTQAVEHGEVWLLSTSIHHPTQTNIHGSLPP